MSRFLSAFVFLLLLPACASGGNSNPGEILLQPTLGGLTFSKPVLLLKDPGAARWFVVEKGGKVLTVDEGASPAATVFADLTGKVNAVPNEAGLLGMALGPLFAGSGTIYLSYTDTATGLPLVSRISRFRTKSGGAALDTASEEILLSLAQPYSNHNGGHIAFGPDGFLYIGFGDGGSAGDPQGHAQNRGDILGDLLRIDVSHAQGSTPYAIPPTNPFAESPGIRPEIWAWGLRNPWRFSFDRATGDLWTADVGQNKWEEVDLILPGRNYGWNIREGNQCYNAATCVSRGLEPPVFEYDHDLGCSVSGGYVYRGAAIPALQGAYVYGDYCSGTIWGLFPNGTGGFANRTLASTGFSISSFAEGPDGELYVLDYRGGGIYRLTAP